MTSTTLATACVPAANPWPEVVVIVAVLALFAFCLWVAAR